MRELQRKQITPAELRVVDQDTADENLKVIITHSPQYGTLEKLMPLQQQQQQQSVSSYSQGSKPIEDKMISINTNANQKFNFILKFNNNATSTVNEERPNFMPVNEFTMADISAGLIYYNHRSPGIRQDRFGFLVYDGFNNLFIIDAGYQVSDYQIFNIFVDLDQNTPPVIEKNNGLDYLYKIEGQQGRLITKNDLLITDEDSPEQAIIIEVTRKPSYGHIEHKDQRGLPISKFSQADVSANKIFYILSSRLVEDSVAEDHFEFDVRGGGDDNDSGSNALRGQKFFINWSMFNFEEKEITVMESEGKVRIHIKKSGNLKRFSMITCKTVSDTAKSNRDSKQFDFVHTNMKVEFNEDESLKACDIVLNKDQQMEAIESFYVVLEDAKYSVVGPTNRIKINILDRVQGSVILLSRAQGVNSLHSLHLLLFLFYFILNVPLFKKSLSSSRRANLRFTNQKSSFRCRSCDAAET